MECALYVFMFLCLVQHMILLALIHHIFKRHRVTGMVVNKETPLTFAQVHRDLYLDDITAYRNMAERCARFEAQLKGK